MPADEFRGAGFVMNSTAPSGAATVGFVIYGSNVEYATETTYESKFYARIVSDGVWSLMWNSNSESQNGSIPVILKTVAPSDD